MPTYQLTITCYVNNEAYKEPQNEYAYSRDNRTLNEREPFIETALNVSLSEEQFEIIKKATLEHWK